MHQDCASFVSNSRRWPAQENSIQVSMKKAAQKLVMKQELSPQTSTLQADEIFKGSVVHLNGASGRYLASGKKSDLTLLELKD